MLRNHISRAGWTFLLAAGFAPLSAYAATPSAREALQLAPIQADIDFDRPAADKIDACKVEAFVEQGGWAVYGENGQLLRRFVDSNKDRKLDQWCYYKNGIEVYRDLDTNFNGKADQYRWLGTAGTRWGIDANENGEIDSWKSISPEEVTAEVVAALREPNAARFQRLVLNAEELSGLGLSTRQLDEFKERLEATKTGFADLQKTQKLVEKTTEWLQFGASRPGVIPAGTDGSTKDLLIYDNVAAIVETDGKSAQLFVGTLINVGNGWRVIDLPKNNAGGGVFINLLKADANAAAPGGATEQSQKLIDDLQKVDAALVKEGSDKAKLNADRAGVLEKLANTATNDTDRATWVKQFADTVGAAVQSGDYPEGLKRLQQMLDTLRAGGKDKDLVSYVHFRHLTAEYAHKIATAKEAEYSKVQDQWLKDLEEFVTTYPKSSETAEALLQLALGHEFSGSDEKAGTAYGRIVSEFPMAEQANKAAGAKLRLESIGKQLQLNSKTTDGKQFDLTQYRGKAVLIQYWATWCQLCKQDMQTLKNVQAKYPKGLQVVGVNLDNDVRTTQKYLAETKWPWPQLFEPGGMESRLANQLGIMSLPTMILVDKNGVVVRRNIHAGELDAELGKLPK